MRTYIDEEALMKLIQRQGYLDFLRRNRNRPIVKVVSGIRRCGNVAMFLFVQLRIAKVNQTQQPR